MKENDEFRTEDNNEYNDDARAVNESELLPIYEAMYFSGDIQPVEDVIISEYEKSAKIRDRADIKKTDIKKKTNPIISALNTIPKKIIVISLIIIAVLGASAGVAVGMANNGKNESPVSSVYAVNSKMQVRLSDGKTYNLPDAQDIRVSDNAMMLYYSKNTSSKTGKFDIRAIDVSKNSSLKKSGTLIDNGVDEGWQVNADGSLLCYSKTESGIKSFYLYSAETGKTQLISSDVEEAFLPSVGDVVYFTRRIASVYSLHRMQYGEEAHNVVSGIDYVNFCDSPDGSEVLYTVQSGNGTNVDVFIVSKLDKPVKICSDVCEVYANEYTYKGNLYFFTKNESTVNWQDFISDPYFEQDVGLQRPVEGDFMVEKGFIFKRYVLDTSAFNAAKKKFEAKQHRDSIRAELDKIDLGLSVKDDYTCFVYNGLTTKKLASGVMLDNVLVCSSKEAPRMIYRKSVIAVDSKIKMDKLMEISADGNITDAIDYVCDAVSGSYSLSDDCIYTWYDGTKVIEYNITDYNAEKTEFILASGSVMYALADGELYFSEISQSELSKGTLVDTSVTDFSYRDGYIYYEKATTSDKISVYRHSVGDSKHHICDDVFSYFVTDIDSVLVLTRQQTDSELTDIGIYENGKYAAIDTDVSLKNFVFNGTGFAYIKNLGKSGIHNAGEMYIYTPADGVKKISEDVTQIIFVK